MPDVGLARMGQEGVSLKSEQPGCLVETALETQTQAGTMAEFRARVSTWGAFGTGKWDKVSVTIMETPRRTPTPDHLRKGFTAGAVSEGGQRREKEG